MELTDIKTDYDSYGNYHVISGYSIRHKRVSYYIQKGLDNKFYLSTPIAHKRNLLGPDVTPEMALTFFRMEAMARGQVYMEVSGQPISVTRPVIKKDEPIDWAALMNVNMPELNIQMLQQAMNLIARPRNDNLSNWASTASNLSYRGRELQAAAGVARGDVGSTQRNSNASASFQYRNIISNLNDLFE